MDEKISRLHRKELLRFLLLKTAPVRSGVKPGELLRVKNCYESRNSEGFRFCLYRRDILEILALDYMELASSDGSTLVLFYHPEVLAQTLARRENAYMLRKWGYPEGNVNDMLRELAERFRKGGIPHEIGVFIGYPLKDVAGFIANLPRTPVHRGSWAVFGNAAASVEKMNLYRQVENRAAEMMNRCSDIRDFLAAVAACPIPGNG